VIDENAFGILVSNHGIEDEEYGLERAEFVERFTLFRSTLRELLLDRSPGAEVRALDLGHALYVEIADGDQVDSPVAWAREARNRLSAAGFVSVAGVTHGGRWVDETRVGWLETEDLGTVGLVNVSHPSEPLRRALYLDAATRRDEADDSSGWGPGTYVDVDAIEALGIKLKNEPTRLELAGAAFVRIGR